MGFDFTISLSIIFSFCANLILFTLFFKFFKTLPSGLENIKSVWYFGAISIIGFGFYDVFIKGISIRYMLLTLIAYCFTVYNELYRD